METNETSYWSIPAEMLMARLETTESGLSSSQAAALLHRYGENAVSREKKTSELVKFLAQFKTPIVLILVVATVISALTGEWVDALIIFLIVMSSSVLSYSQERLAGDALAKLRAQVQVTTRVLRDGAYVALPAPLLVPGDIIQISAGSLIPADGVILKAMDLQIDQSILTGESLPVRKQPGRLPDDTPLNERSNSVYMGTSVHGGSADVLLVQTGQATAFGQIAKRLTLRPPETEFERGIRQFGLFLTQIMLVLVLVAFAINVLFDRPVIEALLFSVALAVGLSPELLPAIISLTLSQGSRIMAKEGVIVRRLNAIENFGSMDTLCTDKTGTLTEGLIRVAGAMDIEGQPSAEVYRQAYLNAALQTGMANSLDEAILQGAPPEGPKPEKIDEIPFDFERERLSVIVRESDGPVLITKGAINSILAIIGFVSFQGETRPLDETTLRLIRDRYAEWSSQGIRVLGVATRPLSDQPDYVVADETDMIFSGFLLLQDQPKPDVSQTIQDLMAIGIRLRIITGDNRLIAIHTAQTVGLPSDHVLTGDELHRMGDDALLHHVDETTIFCEVDPSQKERIILALRKLGHVVGYMGDGINDVPALHAADVSISVNNAADIAKESADLVLLAKDLDVLSRGVILGRTTFHNTMKYVQVTTSANFGNMLSLAGISLILPFLPLLPKQILLLNFLSDFPAITIAQDKVDPEILTVPRRWDIRFIRQFMFLFGAISSVFDIMTFAVLLLVFRAPQTVFQSSWFTVSILTELLILLVMRTHKPFFRSRPAPLLLISSAVVAVITFVLPYLPFAPILGLTPIRPLLLLSLLGITSLYLLVTEVAKRLFYRRLDSLAASDRKV